MKKFKVIIDTDPGVDDTNAIVYALNDPQFDIKLFSISHGNISLSNATRNACHLIDLFGKNIPIVKGYNSRLGNNTEEAVFLHTKSGLGGYKPPSRTKTKPIQKDCADAMFEVIKAYPHQITLLVLGPHTNVAHLFMKHPSAKNLLKQIVMMGGAPNGLKSDPNHNSFNVRTDIPAFKKVIATGIKILMCPSSIGRDEGYYTEAQVKKISQTNSVGNFLAKTFETYWEPGYTDKRIAVNDIAALYSFVYPRLYRTKQGDIELDEKTGKTKVAFRKGGQFKIVMSLKRDEFQNMIFEKLKKMDNIHLETKK